MRNDLIRAIAQQMHEADSIDPTGGRSRQEWAQHNEEPGFAVRVPAPLDGETLYEGVTLSAAEMSRAFELAERWGS